MVIVIKDDLKIAHNGIKATSYIKGQVVELDDNLAQDMIDRGFAVVKKAEKVKKATKTKAKK